MLHSIFQSYGDIDVTQPASIPRRIVHSDSIQCTHSAKLSRSSSTKGSKQHRDASGSEETTPGHPLTHQLSQSNTSTPNKLKDVTSKAHQEQWDKEIPVGPLTALLKMICKMNAPEWWMIGLGLIGSMVAGAIIPLFSIFFGRIVSVFANPPEKVFPLVHPWAGLFLALATVTALATFMKVMFMRTIWIIFACIKILVAKYGLDVFFMYHMYLMLENRYLFCEIIYSVSGQDS